MSGEMISVLYIIGLFALLYFLLIRPQQVRQKKHMEMIKSLKVNDPVITVGGIYGVIVKLKEDTVILKVAENVKIEFLKTAIAQVRRNENT
ncbi:preprotein translocase subunit YajC [Candidatus Desulforudis audaxviator]|uniref:Preprotein translocase, YajC subunit n=1 Tax=Desulforudis audaxviator (strain MP104C) TaxID=477974 RepID=B1I4K7_DESAP|nr:preprotein translocase subunit YajC [Candidatus Desulforudis audaxviator]ACA59867.1 preprotein translocase, YajC subunit [Candidatus Desulforudis audaxviator MP104C]AZK59872.1 Preprotein translocase subunit YajC [Candidatus Desulforudis audaxviator]